jgi:hypothetical protein
LGGRLIGDFELFKLWSFLEKRASGSHLPGFSFLKTWIWSLNLFSLSRKVIVGRSVGRPLALLPVGGLLGFVALDSGFALVFVAGMLDLLRVHVGMDSELDGALARV